MRPVTRLPGMSDLSQESWLRKRKIQDSLAELFGSYGYRQLDTPILEPTELFLRKSGGELASRLYSFTDPKSNAASLRPEFTSPIMRHYLEHQDGIDLPARWQYAGPVFRCEDHGQAGGQFTQIGAELLGAPSILADVEILDLAARVPACFGLSGCSLEVSDLVVVHSVLDAVGVSERAKSLIVNSASSLREGRKSVPSVLERAAALHVTDRSGDTVAVRAMELGKGEEGEEMGGPLAGPGTGERDRGPMIERDNDQYLGQAIAGLDDSQARNVILGIMQWSAADQLGQRDPSEVVDRLLRKLRGGDNPDSLRRALELVSDLAGVRGGPEKAIPEVRKVVQESGARHDALDRFEEFLGLAVSHTEVDKGVVIDFGLVRGLAYYNGLLFDVTHPDMAQPLGGGGRYDALARALGADGQLPALGFAYNLDALHSLVYGRSPLPEDNSNVSAVLVCADGPASHRQALRAAHDLRREGVRAELDVSAQNVDQSIARARRRGIPQVIAVDENGQQSKIKVITQSW